MHMYRLKSGKRSEGTFKNKPENYRQCPTFSIKQLFVRGHPVTIVSTALNTPNNLINDF